MEEQPRDIDRIDFGVYSPDEIAKMAVCTLDSNKRSGPGTVYDPRMGANDTEEQCETCGQSCEGCPGHFGVIELAEPIVHPLFYKHVVNLLRVTCLKCYRLMLREGHLQLGDIARSKGGNRFAKIVEKMKKTDVCTHEECMAEHPEIRLNTTEGNIYLCRVDQDKNRSQVLFTVEEIATVLDNISDSDCRLLGLDPQEVHPRNFIFRNLQVIPPCDRPYVRADGNICDDDITNQYIEIIKANNALKSPDCNELKRQKHVQTIKFRIHTMFNNSSGRAKHTTNGRAIKGFKERLTGKQGQIRNNTMGKRVNQSARTVIGPDPTLRVNGIGCPREIADILTVPEHVTSFNLESLTELVNSGRASLIIRKGGKVRINLSHALQCKGTQLHPGDIIVRGGESIPVRTGKEKLIGGDSILRDGKPLKDIRIPCRREQKLSIGDIVERKLRDGDYVLLNRQPTLHKASMQAVQVKVMPYKTIRMNLAVTKPFNADFDGDEMNLHVPQGAEAIAELKYLSASKHNLINGAASKPFMAIVQDGLLGSYRMTLGFPKIRKDQLFQIAMRLNLSPQDTLAKLEHIKSVYRLKKIRQSVYTGKSIISLMLPNDFSYSRRTGADPENPIVTIHRGVLLEGTLDKSMLGQSHNSLILVLHKEYGPDLTCEFIDRIQFAAVEWALIEGFSIGLKDCIIPDKPGVDQEKQIKDTIQKFFHEAEGIKTTTSHAIIRERRITGALNKAKDVGLRIAKDSLDPENSFLSTVRSGSKGDFFNIAQITGLLGQQNISGARVAKRLNHGKRTMVHYPQEPVSAEMEYESRGFISSSFIQGLNPREYFFHAMSGREGMSDTAMGTATSGYMQRRIVKLTEDMKVQYDGTVRDVTGKIYQLAYGDTGMDPCKTVKVDGKQQACDITRMVNRLNLNFEADAQQKKKKCPP